MSFLVSFETDFTREDLAKLVDTLGAKKPKEPRWPSQVLFRASHTYRWRFADGSWKEADRERVYSAIRTVRSDARIEPSQRVSTHPT